MNLLRSAALLALASLALAVPAQNLVQDPGFEDAFGTERVGDSIDDGDWFLAEAPSGLVDFFSIDIENELVIADQRSAEFHRASIQQRLATDRGGEYTISFDAYGFNDDDAPVLVTFGGTTTELSVPKYTFLDPPTGVTHFSFVQTATSRSTLLRIGSDDEFELDNVSVTLNPVPEPASFAALGLGAVAILRRRKRA